MSTHNIYFLRGNKKDFSWVFFRMKKVPNLLLYVKVGTTYLTSSRNFSNSNAGTWENLKGNNLCQKTMTTEQSYR